MCTVRMMNYKDFRGNFSDIGSRIGVKLCGIIDGILHFVSIAIAIETPFRMTCRGLKDGLRVRPTGEWERDGLKHALSEANVSVPLEKYNKVEFSSSLLLTQT